METFATLGIKVSTEGAVQSKEQLEQYAQTVAKVEAVQSAFANSTLVLSQKTRTALAAEAVEYEKQKQSRIAGFTEQLRQVAEMKRVMDQADSEHMARLNQIKQAESENLRQLTALRKQASEQQIALANEGNAKLLATVRETNAKIIAEEKAQLAKLEQLKRQANLSLGTGLSTSPRQTGTGGNNSFSNVAGLSQQTQAIAAQTVVVTQATTAHNNFIQTMSRSQQTSTSSRAMIDGMTNSYRQFVQAQNQVVSTGNATHSMFDRITTKVIAITSAMLAYRALSALISVPGGIIETNKQMELLRVRLEALTGSVERARVAFKDLVSLDFRTPFDIQGLTQAFLTLKNYGLNPTQNVMEALTETISKMGGTTQNMIGFATQLGQAWSKGRLQMQDMRVMIENGVPVISLLERTTNKSAAAILEMSKNGEITRDVMLKLLEIMRSENFGSSAKMMNTLGGAINNMTTAWIQFQDALLQDKSESIIKRIFDSWTGILTDWTNSITNTKDYVRELAKNWSDLADVRNRIANANTSPLGQLGRDNLKELRKEEQDLLNAQDKILKSIEDEAKVRAENNKQAEVANDIAKINKKEEEDKQKALKESAKIQDDILTIQEKQARALTDLHNANIEARIKGLENLKAISDAQFESDKKGYEESYKVGELNALEYYTALSELNRQQFEKEKKAILDKYVLEKQKLNESVADHKTAFEAIIAWENRGIKGSGAGVISNTGAMGWGQVLPSTAIDPGFGIEPMKQAVEKGKEFFKGSLEEIRKWAIENEKELYDFAKRYFDGLVKHFGSVTKAIEFYGDRTPSYLKGVLNLMNQQTGASKKNIDAITREGDAQREIALLTIKYKQDQLDIDSKIKEEEEKYSNLVLAEKDKLIAKYMQLILSAKEYYEWTLKQAGVKPGDIKGLSDQNTMITVIQQGEAAAEAIKKYAESVDSASQSTTNLNDAVGVLFDGMGEGLDRLVGAFTNMAHGFEDTNKKLAQVYSDRKKLSDNAAKVEEAHAARLAFINNNDFENKKQLLTRENEIYQEQLDEQKQAFAKNKIYEGKLQEEQVLTTVSGIRQMAGAASKMFDENSKARKALHNVEMVLSAIEMAMQIKKLAVDAAAAVLNQGKGDPYSAFARIAAMTAIVGAIIAGVGGYFSGGNASKPPKESDITGTVLGDSTKSSESVSNIVQTLEDIHADEYVELRGINDGVRSLSSGISNLVTRVFQNGGLTQPIMPAGKSGFLNVTGLLIPKKTTYSIIAEGIMTDAFQIGQDVIGKQYDTIEKKVKSLFSTKTSSFTVFTGLADNVLKGLTDIFNTIGQTMLATGDTLGKFIGVSFKEKILSYVIPALTIDLKGLTGEEASKKVNAVISTALDNMAVSVFGDILGQYQQLGEGMLETAIRIVSEIAVVTDALKVSGLKLKPENIIAFSDAIVKALGGLGQFQKAWDSFFDKFYTDAEKQARLKEQLFGKEITTTQKTATKTTQGSFMGKAAVGTTFTEYVDGQLTDLFKLKTPTLTLKQKKAGLTLQDVYPDFDPYRDLKKLMEGGRKGYREVLESININTEKGAKQYAALIKLAPLADQYYTYIEQQEVKKQNIIKQGQELELQLMEAQGRGAEALAIRRKEELAAMDESLRPYQEKLYAQQDEFAYKMKEIEINKQIREAEIQLMEAQGDSAGALAARRSDELAAMDEALRPLQETLYARLDEIEAVKKSIQLAKEQRSLDIDLMEKQGNAAGALAAKRADELAAMDESLRPTKQKIYDTEDRISLINDNLKELSSTFGEWAPKIKTVNELLQENKGKLDNLVNGLAQIQGTTVKTDLEKLQDLTNVKNSISSFRDNLATAIDDAISSAMSAGDKALFLQNKENQLWSQLSTAADPVAIATQLQSVTIARIQAQGQAQSEAIDKANEELQKQYDLAKEERNKQIDALNEQISAAEKLKSFAEDLKQTIASLKFSDLSPLTYDKQLGEAKALYDRTLQGAKSGNETDMANYTNNLNAYLEEARKYYASNEGYTKIFNQLMTDATLLASKGDKLDPAIEAAKKQITQLEELNNQTLVLQSNVVDTSAEQVAALKQIDDAMAALEAQNQGAIDTQTQLVLNQIAELQKIVDGQQAQMDQAKIIGDQLTAALTNPSIPVPSVPTIDGSHAAGLDYVPFNGYVAQLHVGERVLTASQARNSDGTSEELLMELRYLREEVSQLRKEQNEQTGALIQSNYDANDKAAEKVSKGSKEAAKDIAWATKTAPVIV